MYGDATYSYQAMREEILIGEEILKLAIMEVQEKW